jgi:hypothetical protein
LSSKTQQIELYKTIDPFEEIEDPRCYDSGYLNVDIADRTAAEEEAEIAGHNHVIDSGCFAGNAARSFHRI